MKELPDNYVDAVVTDPPYGLAFMGKRWDYDVPSVEIWKEVLRVLKPGGHLLSFGGTRTYHRMVVNIEDAGFEIRDQLQWIYGSGFPKSHDISKAIDKAAGAEREVIGKNPNARPNADSDLYSINGGKEFGITVPSTEDAKRWQGWGTALKPANEPICLARKPLEKGLTIAENVLKYGNGGLNVDKTRIKPCFEARRSKVQEPLILPTAFAYTPVSSLDSFDDFSALSFEDALDCLRRISSELFACSISGKDLSRSLVASLDRIRNELEDGSDDCDDPVQREALCALLDLGSEGSQCDCPTLRHLYGGLIHSSEEAFQDAAQLLGDALEHISHRRDSSGSSLWNSNPHLFCVSVFAWALITADKRDIQPTSGRFPSNVLLDEEAAKVLDAQTQHLHGAGFKTDGKHCPSKGSFGHVKINAGGMPSMRFGDSGGASRFFFTAKHDTMSACNHSLASSVSESLKTIQAILGHIAPLNAEEKPDERLALNVKSVGIQCDSCGTSIALDIARTMSLVSKRQELQASLDSIQDFRSYIQILSLVSVAESWASTGIIPTTKNLSKLFGCALLATEESTRPESLGNSSAPTRFLYCPKASKSERNAGLEGMPKRERDKHRTQKTEADRNGAPAQNFHPTVKPLKLMQYLITQVTPPGGIVLDPFAGSGTTLVAAKKLGFGYVGIEREREYCEIIEKRLEAV